MARLPLVLLALLALAACGRGDGALKVAIIDNSDALFTPGNRLSPGAQHLRAATGAGLVALDEKGEVVPALADRWIVTDDGLSFIFRLRDGTWSDKRELTAESVRAALAAALRSVKGTSLGLDLAPISQVRAMAGRVIEIRLSSPVPTLLQLLAQPELSLSRSGTSGGSGPMTLRRKGTRVVLEMKRPADRGLPEEEDWQKHVRAIELQPADSARAVALFNDGEADLVLGGRIGALPLAPTGPLSRGTVQLDPAIGLFGLQVRRAEGLLATAPGREALAMAIDRPALIERYNIAGWAPTTRVVAPGLPGDPGLVVERWVGQPLDGLRALAGRRVAAWRAAHGGAPVRITVALGRDPGDDALFGELARQLGLVGIVLQRLPENGPAQLVLVDRVARYAEPRWFLDQFACSLRQGPCEPIADALVAAAGRETDPAARARDLADAEGKLTQANWYIPLGSPIRFSLVRSNVTGFYANAWAFHPLPALAVIPK
jgi:ABC-type transport system substrate-binding protein